MDENVREMIIQAPSPAEARKYAARNKEKCRIDWKLMKARILKAGLMMAIEQNPSFIKQMEIFSKPTSLEIGIEFPSGRSICGYPLSWYAGVMWDASDAIINRPGRVLFMAGKSIKYSDKSETVDKFISLPLITQVIVPIGKDISLIGEQFALKNCLPVRYIPLARGKLNERGASELAKNANHILVMEKKSGKQFDELIVSAKSIGKSVKLLML